MKKTLSTLNFQLSILLLCAPLLAWAEKADVSAYNIVWTVPSANSSESMPCGGGDVGLNVWVENGDILFYIARSGTFDENSELLKLGRIRLTLTPGITGNGFKQILHLDKGCVSVSDASTEALIWVDVFRPVIHVEITGKQPVSVKAAYENWRYEDFVPHESQFFSNSFRQNRKEYGIEIKTRKDVVETTPGKIVFYHRNRSDVENIFDVTVRKQWLDGVKHELYNPVRNRTFGGYLQGDRLTFTGVTSSRYLNTDYKSYDMESDRPAKTHRIEIGLHTDQSANIDGWKNGLEEVRQSAAATAKTARKATLDWWTQLWNRSYVFIEGNETDEHWQVARNYMVFRYQLACNAYGQYPTKFNGGLFTFDPALVNKDTKGTPDHRNWTGSDHVAQNQRLVYWNMLKSGDSDMMKSHFDMYLRALRNAEIRVKTYWNHAGACFTEHNEYFGLPNVFEYFLWGALERPDDFEKGVEYNPWTDYQWETVFEFCMMMLETERYENRDIHAYIPLIESCLTFYDEHYRYLSLKRNSRIWDSNGCYVLYPSTACETYKMAYNPTPVICALRSALSRLLELPQTYLTAESRARWEEMLKRIPAIPMREIDGYKMLAPAENWQFISNIEAPQLYPVYPWGIYGVGKPGIEIARATPIGMTPILLPATPCRAGNSGLFGLPGWGWLKKSDTVRSWPFRISKTVYRQPMRLILDYFSLQRCGASATGYLSPCHLDDGMRFDNGKRRDVTGGWHDASDLRKWVANTITGMTGLTGDNEDIPQLITYNTYNQSEYWMPTVACTLWLMGELNNEQ